jgi:hypothetical protein
VLSDFRNGFGDSYISTESRLIDVLNKFFLLVPAYIGLTVIYKLVFFTSLDSFIRTVIVLVFAKRLVVLIYLIL